MAEAAKKVEAPVAPGGPHVGEDFVKKSKGHAQHIGKSSKPVGEKKEWVIARGHIKHPVWGLDENGHDVVKSVVELYEGDSIKLTEEERKRMDPHGHVFVDAQRYQDLKTRERLDAEDRKAELAKHAADAPDAKPLKSPADKLMGNQKPSDDAKDIGRKAQV